MEDESEQDSSLTVEEVEWKRLKNSRITEGFADGKFQGGESTLQFGFDKGYAKGFKLSLPISTLKGLLAVNEIILKETKSPLVSQSSDIQQSLLHFERKCNDLNLKKLSQNEEKSELNQNCCSQSSQPCSGNERLCLLPSLLYSRQLFEVIDDLKELRHKLLNFIRECKQPMLLDQAMSVFENLNIQDVSERNSAITHPLQSSSLDGIKFS